MWMWTFKFMYIPRSDCFWYEAYIQKDTDDSFDVAQMLQSLHTAIEILDAFGQ